MSKAQFLQN
jgi:hypothetical protein